MGSDRWHHLPGAQPVYSLPVIDRFDPKSDLPLNIQGSCHPYQRTPTFLLSSVPTKISTSAYCQPLKNISILKVIV
jgi:hypothetical protein